MDFSVSQALSLFKSAPLIAILCVGVFTIATLFYNVSENSKTQEQQKDTVLVLSILCALLILSMMIVATQI